jgi:hypothetical protein
MLKMITPPPGQTFDGSEEDELPIKACYGVGGEYGAARLTPPRGLIAGDSEAQQGMSHTHRRRREVFSPRRPKISLL